MTTDERLTQLVWTWRTQVKLPKVPCLVELDQLTMPLGYLRYAPRWPYTKAFNVWLWRYPIGKMPTAYRELALSMRAKPDEVPIAEPEKLLVDGFFDNPTMDAPTTKIQFAAPEEEDPLKVAVPRDIRQEFRPEWEGEGEPIPTVSEHTVTNPTPLDEIPGVDASGLIELITSKYFKKEESCPSSDTN